MNARKTECVRGHSLSGDNLYVDPDGNRGCRACRRIRESSDQTPPPSLRDEVAEIVGVACGEVSIRWQPRPVGEFESATANAIVQTATDEVLAVVRRHVEGMDVWADDDVRGDQWNHARDAVL